MANQIIKIGDSFVKSAVPFYLASNQETIIPVNTGSVIICGRAVTNSYGIFMIDNANQLVTIINSGHFTATKVSGGVSITPSVNAEATLIY